MSDKPTIIVGLAIFLILATFPIWYTLGFSGGGSPPDLATPEGAFVFSVPWSAVEGEPEEDIDDAKLRTQFEKHNISLSEDAELKPGNRAGQWKVIDGGNRYLVAKARQSEETVRVYDGCVQEDMGANHMEVLINWRERVVRGADAGQVEVNGEPYPKSLTGTCLKCHSRQNFCQKCHEYANVLPARLPGGSATPPAQRGIRCWNCHVDPKEETNNG
ncbi:MAG: hypothetical protein ACYSWU_24995 [Planctomycetota bacterium]|jgi:hypothetical protein